jgi:hypothetical protein
MSVTIDPAILAALEATPLPYDFYREVHKGLRRTLFDVTVDAGKVDYEVADERDRVVDRVHATIELLHSHHRHEDEFVQPLLELHAPRLAAIVASGHTEIESDLIEIELVTDRLVGATGAEAVVSGLGLYHTLAMFTARYLAHMALEEGDVMKELRRAMTVAELFEVDMALRGSIAPPAMCTFITIMAPAMNLQERVNMLGGMRAGATAEIFELFRATAEAALEPADYRDVAEALGLGTP